MYRNVEYDVRRVRDKTAAAARRPKVLVIAGTRPEAIKLAPVLLELQRTPSLDARFCVTAQHREMLDQVVAIFGLRPDHDLDIMQAGQALDRTLAALIPAIGDVVRAERPELAIVVGDTTTGLAACLACFYEHVAVGHVEAGLRTGKRYLPFPEEMLRKLMTQLTTVHFAPTRRAAENLRAEKLFPDAEVFLTGNPVVDAVRWVVERRGSAAAPYAKTAKRMILVTAHRRENFGEPLRRICRALIRITERHSDVELVYPVHRNPNVAGPVNELLGARERIHLIGPQDYVNFAYLMADCTFILTDSGGIQEEAPVLGKPVLVLRDETERPEAIEAGTALLVGTDEERIVAEAERLLTDDAHYANLAHAESPFGDGHAAERIVAIIRERLQGEGDGALGHAFRP